MTKYLLEIRNRIFFLLTCSIAVLLIIYSYKEIFLYLIVEPSTVIKQEQKNFNLYYFIFTGITDLFVIYIRLCIFITLQLIILYAIYHIFSFLVPALYYKEYILSRNFIKFIFFGWVMSLILLNYVIIPFTWFFFYNFQHLISNKFIYLHFETKLDEYLNFYISIYYICIMYCQIFVILMFSLSFSFNLQSIKRFRKLYYFIFLVLSTLVSPPDIFSQISLSFIMIIFYEFIVLSFIFRNILVR